MDTDQTALFPWEQDDQDSYCSSNNLLMKFILTRNILKKDIWLNFNCGIFLMYCCLSHLLKVVSEFTFPFLSIPKLPDKLIKGHMSWENIDANSPIVLLDSAFRILPSVPEVYTEWMPTVPSVTISYKNCRKQVH